MSFPRRSNGTTLLELLIVMGLFGVLLYSVYLFIDRGVTMYRESSDALEVRQQALVGMAKLSDDVRDTAIPSVHCESTTVAPTSDIDGIVFVSLKDDNEETHLDPDTERLNWQKTICYYLAPQADGNGLLMRKEQMLLAKLQVSDFVPDPYGSDFSPIRNPQYFRDTGGLRTRQIARRVQAFTIRKDTDLIFAKMTYDLSGRYRHMVELQTKIFPRL